MLTRAINIIAKPVGPICNLDCQYCFYLEKEKLYPSESSWIMPREVLENFIRQYIAGQDGGVVQFVWQGGEPTLAGLAFYEEAVALQHKYGNGKRIENAFQTNGILLDEAWCDFFVKHNFLVGVSIDGPQWLHDQFRIDKGGKPTFDAVVKGIGFLKKHGVAFNTLTVVNRANSYHPLEVYHFLKGIGSGFMQFIPAVEERTPDRSDVSKQPSPLLSDWSVEPAQYGRFLCKIFDEWVRHDVGKYFIQTFDVALESWYGMPASLCVFAETCGNALAIEHNGDLYACDHYVFPEYQLGNIEHQPLDALVRSEPQQKFGRKKRNLLPDYCKKCAVRFACNGGCPKNRFTVTPDGQPGLNYLCAGYKQFFNHIAPYLRFMASELSQSRPPANVMMWIKGTEQGCRGSSMTKKTVRV